MNEQELTYWITLALMPKMWTRRKNEIYVNCFKHEPKLSIVDLFENTSCWGKLGLTGAEVEQFMVAHQQLANNSFLVENMLAQGYDILPLHSDEYPTILKSNLKTSAPTVIFTKGNKQLLQEQTIGIVGSRNADAISLRFADNVARKAADNNIVVVSGFAKGIDRQSLDSVLDAGGKSIIVLPQGIMTFNAGFKQYFKHIAQGRVIVMSTFAPKAPWSKEFAMARNPIIYGMSSKIYVAQSDDKGGTWSGVVDGLRKKRTIYVRWPEAMEKNANVQLVQKGALAVDINGNALDLPDDAKKTTEQKEREEIENRIIAILSNTDAVSVKEVAAKLNINWSEAKMRKHLETMPQVQRFKKKNRIYYCLKDSHTPNLFNTPFRTHQVLQ